MAKYLRPRRGTLANADSQNLLLKKGELFFEYPVGNVGMAPAKLMIGNGITQYTSSNPVTTDTSGSSTNSFAPALVHPVLYRPKFTDSNCATASWTFNAGTEAISNIKPWVSSSNPGKVLPDIIGNIKQALVNHADSLTKLNNDLDGKASTSHNHDTKYSIRASNYDQLLNTAVNTNPTKKTLASNIDNFKYLLFTFDTGTGGITSSGASMIPVVLFKNYCQTVVIPYPSNPYITVKFQYNDSTHIVVSASDTYRTVQVYGIH